MSASEINRSTRAISCTWNRIVRRSSSTTVTIVPSATRRRRLSSATSTRKLSRSRSYARASAMSSSVSLRLIWVVIWLVMSSLLGGDAIGAGDHLDRVRRHPPGLLRDGGVGEMAVAGDDLATGAVDLLGELLGDRDRQLG